TIAHRTMPLPSYAEVTSLRTGRTILVRVERRGPPAGNATIALSPAAAAQLGTGETRTPIRIRRVNPPEPERAALRAGQPAPLRMDTPMSLVGVLMHKLEPGAAPVAPSAEPAAPASTAPVTAKHPAVMPSQLKPETPAAARPSPAPVAAPQAAPHPAVAKPAAPANASPARAAPKPTASGQAGAKPAGPAGPTAPTKGDTVVQVGAYASRASADKVAARVGGTVSAVGKLFRVRIGGLATPQAASAALAKARAAGYSDARIQHAH
ncbi:MAG TPA: SPOR domain-containing protein, partial [Novosphingobium sp.]